MTTTARLSLTAMLTAALAVSPQVLAQSASGNEELSIGVRLSAFNFDSGRIYDRDGTMANAGQYDQGFSDIMPGLELAVPLTERWSIRSYYDLVEADVRNTRESGNGHSFGADALYHFDRGFYLGAGINNTKLDEHRDRLFRGTVGYRHDLNDNLFFRAEYALQTESDYTDQAIIAGLNWKFGEGGSVLAQTRGSAEREAARMAEEERVAAREAEEAEEVTPRYDEQIVRTREQVEGNEEYAQTTPEGYVMDSQGRVVYEEVEIVQELRVRFEFDSAEVSRDYQGDIREMAEFMREYDDVTLTIEGHTDLIGPADYNQDLSERRAASVKRVLVQEYGVADNRIETVGYGMERPLYDEITLESNAQNRRIEAELSVTELTPMTRD